MEEILNNIWASLSQYVSIPYMLTVIFTSYLFKKYFGQLLSKITFVKWRPVYTVLVIATLWAVPFAIWAGISWQVLVLSYTVATSLHELAFERIEKRL